MTEAGDKISGEPGAIPNAPDFRLLFESAPALYLILDRNLKIVAVTDAYAKATRTERIAILGRGLFEVFPDNPADPKATGVHNLHLSLKRVLTDRVADTMALQKYDIPRPDSEGGGFEERYWSPINTPILDADGQVDYIIHRVEDVTDYVRLKSADGKNQQATDKLRKRTEQMEADLILRAQETQRLNQQLNAANRELAAARDAAEAASRAKSEFLANMSHEIRTPMTAILGYTDLMLNPSQSAADRLNCVEIIRLNGDHLLSIINDILDLSRIEAGRMQIERIACSPCRILQEVESIMNARAAEKKLRLIVQSAGPVPAQINSDPTRLRQILINLVGNAVKFTHQGTVKLELRLIEQTGGNKLLAFQVSDTGIGIPASELDLIFQPFVQADTSVTRCFGGSGLGLTISRRLARMLGGDIAARSTPGIGSVFTLTIDPGPLDGAAMLAQCGKEESDQPVDEHADHPPLQGHILLAEDNIHNQRLLSLYLKQAGAEVTAADNGQIVCELAMRAKADGMPFGLIFMDMQMPVMDGYTATAKLRSAGCTCPIVALTAHAMIEDREKCLNCGCTDFLTKPTTRDELIDMARKYLKSNP